MKTLSILCALLFSIQIIADDSRKAKSLRIQLNAILNNAVVVTINGSQQMLKLNSYSSEGFKLTKIEQDKITLLISGVPRIYKLGAAITASKSSASGKVQLSIQRDSRGMFRSEGQINDMPVKFLIDTGATFIAISSTLAKQLNIDYLGQGIPQMANTASGAVTVSKVVLNNVSIGSIKLYMIDAVVVEGDFPVTPLLGMSFLQRLKMNNDGYLLTLEKKN